MSIRRFLSGVALTALSLSAAQHAHAQSTASQIDEEVVIVTGTRTAMEGVMSAEQAPKARASITQDYLETQASGQTILESINLIPGVNFTNNDAFGASGGNIIIRGFDGARISLTVDGVPLNDTGNYAIYSSQQLDPELISRANVNLGTTDVDSPTASATGGTVNYITRIPGEEAGAMLTMSAGSDNFQRIFGLVDTGAFGPWATRGWAAASYTDYDQFIGPGGLNRVQYNGGLYQPVGSDGDFMRLSANYSESRNNFYYRVSQTQFALDPIPSYFASCNPPTPGAGVQNSNTDGCSGGSGLGYFGLNINPSNTGNIRGASRFSLGDSLTLTVDPSFQYVRANGGGSQVFSETALQLRGGTPAAGVDLNRDGDIVDTVRLYSPSNTATYRYELTSSLIWDINETNRIRVGYTWDWGRHRQTGEYGYLTSTGDPEDVFGGRLGAPIFNGNGEIFQKRNRLSIASLTQWSAEYRGDFLNDALTLVVGVRAPQFERELNQNCYSVRGSSSSTQYCTTQTPVIVQPDGFVRFVAGGTQYAPPFEANVEYEDVLPNVGVTYRPGEDHQIFFSYAEGLSAPRTDDLYSGITAAQLPNIVPETSQAYDIGYRYQGGPIMATATIWYNQFQNRIERTADPDDPTLFYSRNVGDVDLWGAEASIGWQVTDAFFLYGAASTTDSELKLTGAEVVETPDVKYTLRAEYEWSLLTLGAQARYVGERFANDANTEVAPSYTVVDLDARFSFAELLENDAAYLQFNVINLFDEEYLGAMSSGTNTGAAFYNIGAPQTVMVTLGFDF